MANIKSAIKRARQNIVRRARNVSQRSTLRTNIKKVIKSIESKDLEQAKSTFLFTQSIVDKSASKGLIHKNRAARYKKRLNSKIKQLSEPQQQ